MTKTNSQKILDYCEKLSKLKIDSFDDYIIINPYKSNKKQITINNNLYYRRKFLWK